RGNPARWSGGVPAALFPEPGTRYRTAGGVLPAGSHSGSAGSASGAGHRDLSLAGAGRRIVIMFRRLRQKSHQVDTLIGAGTRIIGDVQFTGGFHIDGRVQGNVDAAADCGATLSVSDGGVVEGSVAVPHV